MTRDVLDDLFEMRDKARADAGDFTARIESGSDYDSLSDEQPGVQLWRRFVDDGDSQGLLGFTQDEMEWLVDALKPCCRMLRTTKYCAKRCHDRCTDVSQYKRIASKIGGAASLCHER
jgi:hypothetical protein